MKKTQNPLGTLREGMMTDKEFASHIRSICEEEWNEQRAEDDGAWNEQDETTKEDYFCQLCTEYADVLGKACCDCRFVATNNEGSLVCKNNDCEHYNKQVDRRNCCNRWDLV